MYLFVCWKKNANADPLLIFYGTEARKAKFNVSYEHAYPNKLIFVKNFEKSLKPYAVNVHIFDIVRHKNLEAFCEFKCIADKIKYKKKLKEFYKNWGTPIKIV